MLTDPSYCCLFTTTSCIASFFIYISPKRYICSFAFLVILFVLLFSQMYRTVKSTDKPASSSGPMDGIGSGSGDDNLPDSVRQATSGGDMNPQLFNEHNRSSSECTASPAAAGAGDVDCSSSAANSDSRARSDSRDLWPSSNGCDPAAHRLVGASRAVEGIEPACRSSSLQLQVSSHELSCPSLEFTLGRPNWHGADHD